MWLDNVHLEEPVSEFFLIQVLVCILLSKIGNFLLFFKTFVLDSIKSKLGP